MFKPLYEYVLIEKNPEPDTTASGLVISTKENPNAARFGEVLAVGDGYRTDQPTCLALRVKPGDRVLFRPRSAVTVDYDGASYYLIRESDLMGIDTQTSDSEGSA